MTRRKSPHILKHPARTLDELRRLLAGAPSVSQVQPVAAVLTGRGLPVLRLYEGPPRLRLFRAV
jgi:hypothetical protein